MSILQADGAWKLPKEAVFSGRTPGGPFIDSKEILETFGVKITEETDHHYIGLPPHNLHVASRNPRYIENAQGLVMRVVGVGSSRRHLLINHPTLYRGKEQSLIFLRLSSGGKKLIKKL